MEALDFAMRASGFRRDDGQTTPGRLGPDCRASGLGTGGWTAQTTFTDAARAGSVSIGPQSPNPVCVPQSATYTITVSRQGAGGGAPGHEGIPSRSGGPDPKLNRSSSHRREERMSRQAGGRFALPLFQAVLSVSYTLSSASASARKTTASDWR
jgi:hypothetical protein